jgi:hypothetical protein
MEKEVNPYVQDDEMGGYHNNHNHNNSCCIYVVAKVRMKCSAIKAAEEGFAG